jgi:hypothetical protein
MIVAVLRGLLFRYHFLDVVVGATDIWLSNIPPLLRPGGGLNNLGSFQTIVVSDPPQPKHELAFAGAVDCPTTPSFPGQERRCKGKIVENLLKAERQLLFQCALVARKDSTAFQLALSDPYGYHWILEVPSGATRSDPSFFSHKRFFPKTTRRPPFDPLELKGPTANEYFNGRWRDVQAKYDNDCATGS